MEKNERMKKIAQLLAECDDAELDQLSVVLATTKENQQTVEDAVNHLLLTIGVPDALKGHRCLRKAIVMAVEDEFLCDKITTRLYPVVAKACGTTASRTERAIRHAIEVAWDRCELEILNRYFGNTISPNKGRPTNGEFIARMANIIRAQCR